jgi:hypothetical protein
MRERERERERDDGVVIWWAGIRGGKVHAPCHGSYQHEVKYRKFILFILECFVLIFFCSKFICFITFSLFEGACEDM